MPCVSLTVECVDCGCKNTTVSMPPVARVGQTEQVFCRHCGTMTVSKVVEIWPDAELRERVVGGFHRSPPTEQLLRS